MLIMTVLPFRDVFKFSGVNMSSYFEFLCNHWRNKARIFEYRYHRISLGVLNCLEDFSLGFLSHNQFKVDDYSHFYNLFLRDQNSQHFNEDLLGVNASAFSFVLCFKATDYAGASNYVISAN